VFSIERTPFNVKLLVGDFFNDGKKDRQQESNKNKTKEDGYFRWLNGCFVFKRGVNHF
jgi:hypothetical protein